ncbi:hypothetical protein ABC795_12160 [Blastococcus sp. HT6-30]|uniref:hypothetical protein n=1 Tax=Blastococcus sp. HT6-30 TaxID=3144843 RepID=UPI00321A67D7
MSRPPRPTSRRRRVATATCAVGLVLLAGCGGNGSSEDAVVTDAAQTLPTQPGDSGGGGSAPATPTGVEGDVLTETVTLEDGGIIMPSRLAAGPYEIEVVNEGGLAHDLTVERDGEQVASTDPIQAGLTGTLTVTLEQGQYVFYSAQRDDRGQGIEVTVQVE